MTDRTVDGTATAGMAVRHLRFNAHLEGKFNMRIARQPGLLGLRLFAPDKRDMHGIWIAMGTALDVSDPWKKELTPQYQFPEAKF